MFLHPLLSVFIRPYPRLKIVSAMRFDGVTIALRSRSAWEAVDLGVALVRANAARIYAAWLLATLPAFVAVNAACALIGAMWPAPLILWWLKPAFDRIPLFVVSRAVFGEEPALAETLRAQRSWGWRALASWLTFRRLHPGRAMLLPVDLLEAPPRETRRKRIDALMRRDSAPNIMLTIVGVHMEAIFGLAVWMLALMFVPIEFFSDSLKAMWENLFDKPPLWGQALVNFVGWLAMTLVEPFYVGAGFGLYLNRRVQLEGWDIELAFRRLAARLAQPLAAALLAAVVVLHAPAARADAPAPKTPAAQDGAATAGKLIPETKAKPLAEIFGEEYRKDDGKFVAAVKRAYLDDDLNPKQKIGQWKPRLQNESEQGPKPKQSSPMVSAFGEMVAFAAKFGLWIVVAGLLMVLLFNVRRWLPWVAAARARRRAPDAIEVHDVETAAAMPDDIANAVRALWERGRAREALSLLYRASVSRLADRLGTPLPPGATEADCLRHARKLGEDAYAALFARIVRCWQAAAYAQRLPAGPDVEALLRAWQADAAANGAPA